MQLGARRLICLEVVFVATMGGCSNEPARTATLEFAYSNCSVPFAVRLGTYDETAADLAAKFQAYVDAVRAELVKLELLHEPARQGMIAEPEIESVAAAVYRQALGLANWMHLHFPDKTNTATKADLVDLLFARLAPLLWHFRRGITDDARALPIFVGDSLFAVIIDEQGYFLTGWTGSMAQFADSDFLNNRYKPRYERLSRKAPVALSPTELDPEATVGVALGLVR